MKAFHSESGKTRIGPLPLSLVSRTPIRSGSSRATSTQLPFMLLKVLFRQKARLTSAGVTPCEWRYVFEGSPVNIRIGPDRSLEPKFKRRTAGGGPRPRLKDRSARPRVSVV